MSTTKPLSLSCHCRTTTHTFTVPISSLPLPSNLCNCTTSRRISGSLLTSYIPITHPTSSSPSPQNPALGSVTCYPSSSILNRWFCSTCGTHMYIEYLASGDWWAATGTLEYDGDVGDVVRYESAMWIGDTRDGGASHFLPGELRGRELKRWMGEAGSSEEVDVNWPVKKTALSSGEWGGQREGDKMKAIHAHCHCRGVEFWISPPNESSFKTARSPFPDLMIPHSEGRSQNPENVAWWVPSPFNSTANSSSINNDNNKNEIPNHERRRYLAGTCTCRSCRRSSGFDITFWAFIPTSNIFLDSALTKPLPTSPPNATSMPIWGTMRTYNSSSGVTRAFCSVCGANVFWQGDEATHGRYGLLDVAVGLLDAPSGARAEEILTWWTGRVSFCEEGRNRALVEGLGAGLREWGRCV